MPEGLRVVTTANSRIQTAVASAGERSQLTVHVLKIDRVQHIAKLQQIIEGAPAYSLLVKGRLPVPSDAEEILADSLRERRQTTNSSAAFGTTTGWSESDLACCYHTV